MVRRETHPPRPKESSPRLASGTMPATASAGADEAFALLDAVADAVVAVDEDERIAHLNPAASRLTGWSAPEAKGRAVGEVLALRGEQGDVIDPTRAPVHHGRGALLRGVSLVTRDGGARVVDVSIAHARSAYAAIVVTMRDAGQAAAIQEQLVHADRLAALGTLAAGVAHEINNPLTYVLVNVEHVMRQLRSRVATGEPMPAEDVEAQITPLAQALDGATRVRGIVRDLMTFSRGHVDKKGLIDVRRVIEASLEMTAHELRHRAHVERRLREVPPVVANESRVGQVFLNLLVNAARAIPEGDVAKHQVTVETDVDEDGNVVATVRDTGVGISAEDLPHVFDPFFTVAGQGESTGLGLSIAHGIVRSFGGSLTVASVLGQGSEFRVTLPAAPGYDATKPSRSTLPGVAIPRRVLVVDEDARVAEAIAKSLADEHSVDVTTDARDALARLARGERYDVILCDLMMPNMTGMDLYREVLRVAPDVASRMVFLSGGVYTPRARAFVESLPNRCLEKPPDLAKLREIVRRRGA